VFHPTAPTAPTRGPFAANCGWKLHSGKTAADYVRTLESDPPDRSSYEIISIFERDDEVCMIYKFEEKGVAADMAQLFKFDSGKISKSTLIFDSRQFA